MNVLAQAIALFPSTFHLRVGRVGPSENLGDRIDSRPVRPDASKGTVFRICPVKSYHDDSLALIASVQLVVQRQLVEPLGDHAAGDFIDYVRCTPSDLRARLLPDPAAPPKPTLRQAQVARRIRQEAWTAYRARIFPETRHVLATLRDEAQGFAEALRDEVAADAFHGIADAINEAVEHGARLPESWHPALATGLNQLRRTAAALGSPVWTTAELEVARVQTRLWRVELDGEELGEDIRASADTSSAGFWLDREDEDCTLLARRAGLTAEAKHLRRSLKLLRLRVAKSND